MLPTDTASKSASITGAFPNSFRELLDRYYGAGTEGTIARIIGAREVVRLSRPGGNAITFGDPDESWDYRTSTVDRDGRFLPPGAVGWTPEGVPYYGSGIPSGARAMETLPGRMGSIVGPITNEFTEWMSGIRNRWDMYRPGGNEPTTLQRAGQISKELLTGFGEGWNALFARPIETAVGLQRGAEEAGEGSPLPDISGALRESGAVQGALRGGIKPEGAEWFVNFVMGLNPLLGAYNAFRLVTSPKPTDEKTRILGENLAASRIAYSAWKDPALRQEFIRRYMAGEDPYLLGKELQRPWAEMWGSLILDPTNAIFLAGVVGKFAHSGRLLTEAAKALGPSDGMRVALRAFSEAKTEAQVVNASESLVRASVAQTRAAATEAAKLARGRNVWAVTTGATRDLAAEEASDIAGLLFATHKNDPERAVEILRLGAQMASESADEVMGAVGELARHQLAPYLFSESFTRVGLLLRKLLTGSDDVIDAGRFLKEVQGVSDDPIKLAELLGKRMEGAASKLYPTVAERVAAGEDVPRLVRQLERLAEGRGPIGTINRMFASVYMGLSPGYAVRNALTNYVHMFFDYGPGTFQRTPTAAAETAAKWLGGTRPVAMTRGFTPAKLVGANRSRLPFTRLAGWFESGASRMIYGNAVERSMRSMLVPGKGLPDIRVLVDAGLSPEAIRYVTSEIVRNYGDTAAAEKAIRTAMSVGSADAFRSLEFLRPSEIRFLQNMPAGGTSLYDRLVNLLKDAPDAATGRRRIAELFAEFEKEAGHAAGQALTFDGAELATRPLFTAMVQAEASRLGLSAKEAQELIAIREFVGGRAMSMAQEVIGSELSKIVPAIRSMAGDATIPTALAQEGVSLQTRVASRVEQLQAAANKLRQEAGLAFRGVKAGTPEAEAVWGPWGEKMSALYREAHAATLQDISAYLDRVTAAIPNYDQANLNRALGALQDAALWDNATVEGNRFVARVGAGAAAAPESGRSARALTDMSPGDFRSLLAETKEAEAGLEVSLFGEEGARRYANAQRMANGLDPIRSAAGSKVVEEMEAGLSQAQRNRLFGIGETGDSYEELYNIRSAFEDIADAPTQDLFGEIGRNLGNIRPDIAIQSAPLSEQAAFIKVREANRALLARGLSADDILRGAAEYLERQGLSADDVSVLWRRWQEAGKVAAAPALEAPGAAGNVIDLARPYVGGVPSQSQFLQETATTRKAVQASIDAGLEAHWGERIAVTPADEALVRYLRQADGTIAEARLLAMKVADNARDFTLLNYTKRRGIDAVVGILFPYQYWYSRTYINWMRRFAREPEVIAAYAKYRRGLEEAHAGAPEWWKYNVNTNELLGLDAENPLYFNLEATLNPLNGLVGVDFENSDRRQGWFANTIDDLGKFGPSTWTPISLAIATAMYMKGEKDAAAAWAGRLIPQTAAMKSGLALLHGKVSDLPLQGEFDPAVQFFSGGMDPYERRRVARALGGMIQDGTIDEDTAADTARTRTGPYWNEALDRAVNQRAPGQLASFLAGVGFKPRTQADIQTDEFYADYHRLLQMRAGLSPDEWRSSWDNLREAYPFMDAMLLARKDDDERDRAFAYNVIARIPPSQSDDYAEFAGIPQELLSSFYESKGDMSSWSEGDRLRFMGGMIDLAAVLRTPNTATRAEWTRAKSLYDGLYSRAEATFGSDIWDRVDAYLGARGETDEEKARAERMLDSDPEIGAALDFKSREILGNPVLFSYYASLRTVEGYYQGQMWADIERKLGSDIWDKWDEYFAREGPERRAYWNSHPELAQYGDLRDSWDPIVAERMVTIGGKLREVRPELRELFGATSTQEAIAGGPGFEQLPQLPWDEWVQILGPSLSRLVEDYALLDDAIPASVLSRLGQVGDGMGIDNPNIILELAAQSARGGEQQVSYGLR